MTRAIPGAGAWALGILLGTACGGCAGDRFREGNALFEAGRYSEAIPHYEAVIAERERLKDAYDRLAFCHEAVGSESQAIAILEKARVLDRHDEYTLRHLARLYAHKGFLDPAIGAYRDLLARNPGDAKITAEVARLDALKTEK